MLVSASAFLPVLLLSVVRPLSAAVEEVDQKTKSSLEEVLKVRSRLRMDGAAPLKMSTPQRNALQHVAKHPRLELAEETLSLIYHELFEAPFVKHPNASEIRYRSSEPSARQTFLSEGLSQISEWMMRVVERSLDELPSLPRLEAQECVKRSVCEAHNQPKKYGLIGLILQLLFPPYTKAEDPQNVVSKYQLAARYGRQSNANCGVQYDGCMLNLLDIVQALVNAFVR